MTFFQVTSKVTHYFLIYKKISELLFQKSNASYFFPIYWLTVIEKLTEIK